MVEPAERIRQLQAAGVPDEAIAVRVDEELKCQIAEGLIRIDDEGLIYEVDRNDFWAVAP